MFFRHYTPLAIFNEIHVVIGDLLDIIKSDIILTPGVLVILVTCILVFLFSYSPILQANPFNRITKPQYDVMQLAINSKDQWARALKKYEERIVSLELLKSLNRDKLKETSSGERLIVNVGDMILLPLKNQWSPTTSIGSLRKNAELIYRFGLGSYQSKSQSQELELSQNMPLGLSLASGLPLSPLSFLRMEAGSRIFSPAKIEQNNELKDLRPEYFLHSAYYRSFQRFFLSLPLEVETLNLIEDSDLESLDYHSENLLSAGAGVGTWISFDKQRLITELSFLYVNSANLKGNKLRARLVFQFSSMLSFRFFFNSYTGDPASKNLTRYGAGLSYFLF